MTTIYDDVKYVITETSFSTPTRLYPLGHATARLRQDPHWLALCAAALAVAAILMYGDLLTTQEYAALVAIPVTLLVVGMNMGMLAIDTVGHKRIVVFTSPSRARKIFAALRRLKLAEISRSDGLARLDGTSGN